MKILIISVIILNLSKAYLLKEINCPSPKCVCEANSIKCTDFEKFDELNFKFKTQNNASINEIDILDLKPIKPLILDDTLKLNGLKINKQVLLRNMKGFLYRSNPFENVALDSNGKSAVELQVFDSEFEFYETREKKLDCDCNSDIFIKNSVRTILTKFSKLWLNNNIKYSNNMCPFVFWNTHYELVIANFLNETNMPIFKNVSLPSDRVLNSTINYLYLFNVKLNQLDNSLLNRDVFANIKTLQIFGTLNKVDKETFKSFQGLKSIVFELFNFNSFIRGANTEWMKNLYDFNLNGVNNTKKPENKNNIIIQFNDRKSEFEYTDNDFCLFKNFPNKIAFPVIKTKPNLKCSCTILWLMKYFKVYNKNQRLNILLTPSVDKCLADPVEVFNQKLNNCSFESKIKWCESRSSSLAELNSNLKATVDTTLEKILTTPIPTTQKLASLTTTVINQEAKNSFIRSLTVIIGAIGFFVISTVMGLVLFLFK